MTKKTASQKQRPLTNEEREKVLKTISPLGPEELKERIEERYPVKTRAKPYGKISVVHKIDPKDPYKLLPCEASILVLEEGFDMLDGGIGLRQVAPWLTERMGKNVAYQTLSGLYTRHRKPFLKGRKTQRKEKPREFRPNKTELALNAQRRKTLGELNRLEKLEKKRIRERERNRKQKTKRVIAKVVQETGLSESNPEAPKIGDLLQSETTKVVFKPNPGPQEDFLASSEMEILYGGAAGGGKSYALLADPIRYFHHPEFRGLLVRRTNDELKELKQKSKELYRKIPDIGARWSEQSSTWTFKNGGTLWMTYLDRDDDLTRFQGQSFTWVGFDELTHWPTPAPWDYLRSRLRRTSTASDIPVSMRATTNPGGIGHAWVKKMFVDPSPPNKPFWATDIETGEVLRYPETHKREELRGKPLFQRKFIPASLYDNPYLSSDGLYELNLLSLPENEKQKLLYGSWDIIEGAAFPEFSRPTHVVEPFEIPQNWRKFRAMDWGYASYTACLWFAIDPGERLWVYRELYVSKKTPEQIVELIKQAEYGEQISYGVLDSSVWHKRGEGPSPAEYMNSRGLRWRPSDRSKGSRTNGFNRLHELLQVNPYTEEPEIFFFNTLRQTLADIPSLPLDPNGLDDIDEKYPSDHTYDALRYGIMSRPRSIGAFEYWSNSKPTPIGLSKQTSVLDTTFGY